MENNNNVVKLNIPEVISEKVDIDQTDLLSFEESHGYKKDEVNMLLELKDYAIKSLGYSWMNDKDANYYNGVNSQIVLFSTILSVLSAVFIAGFITQFEGSRTTSLILGIISILFNVVISILQSYRMINNFDMKITRNLDKASKFGRLFRHIKLQFVLPESEKEKSEDLLRNVMERFNEYDSENPFLRSESVTSWEDQYKKIKKNPSDQQQFFPSFRNLNKEKGLESIDFINEKHEGKKIKDKDKVLKNIVCLY